MLTACGASRFTRRLSDPGDDSGIVCFKFWQLLPVGDCPYQFSYCHLQPTAWFVFNPNQPHGLVYKNVADMLLEIDTWLEDPIPKMMLGGELQDSLVFETAPQGSTFSLARSCPHPPVSDLRTVAPFAYPVQDLFFVAISSVCCMLQQHSRGGRKISAKNRITVNLEDDEYQALQQIAARVDRSLAWLGRRAIRDLLQRETIQFHLDFPDEDTTGGRTVPK